MKGMKNKYDEYAHTYTFTAEEYEKATREAESNWKGKADRRALEVDFEVRNETIGKVKKLEGDLIDLLNENGQLKIHLQKRVEKIA